jgi:type II secretory pathway pseudopilin PulG
MIELLIATAVLAVVMGAVFGLLQAAIRGWSTQPQASDQLQRLRVAASSLQTHLAAAGGGVGPRDDGGGTLHDYFAPVLPYRSGDSAPDPPGTFRSDVISLMYVPRRPAFTTVLAIRNDTGSEAILDTSLDCGVAPRSRCGFEAGQQVVVLDAKGRWDRASVVQADEGSMVVAHMHRLRADPAARPVLAEILMHTYYLGTERSSGTPQLVHYDGDRTSMPAVDDVIGLTFEYWGEAVPPTIVRDGPSPRVTYGPAPPPVGTASDGWPDGENCTFSVIEGAHVPRLAILGGAGAWVPLPGTVFTDGPWCPNDAEADRYDADLLRIRRVRARLRLQAAPWWLRGPGTADRVADAIIELDVAPRALALPRLWQ